MEAIGPTADDFRECTAENRRLEVHGRLLDEVLANPWMADETKGARVLGGIEQVIEPAGDAGVLTSRVIDFERAMT